ncbi:MAG TPA: ABC transporter permease [Anaerolineae bacterium]|jgi:simple sugar transport system permease protein|nr:ABC transporter permease [Anaerolineae bacterium]
MAGQDASVNQEPKRSFRDRFLRPLVVPTLSILTSLIIVAIIIIITADNPAEGIEKVGKGYWGIIDGAFLRRSGLINTLVATSPLILTSLAVAIPFHAGLFNIGAEGQYMMGALFGTVVGIYLDLPPIIHPIAVIVAAVLGGMLWGFIPGLLKAWLNSHEVINTIMLNFIAIALVNMLVRNVLKDPNPSTVQTLPLQETAELARITGRLHWGFFIAVAMAVLAWYFLFKTTWGFALRTTGQNRDAADYAGIRYKRWFVYSFVIAGGLAAMAGIMEVQGLTRVLPIGFAAGYGFDAIAVSLLAANNPLAIIPASLIFGALRIGGDFLQIRAGLSVHIVSIFRALILLFVAAPEIVRAIYRIKAKPEDEAEVLPPTRWG